MATLDELKKQAELAAQALAQAEAEARRTAEEAKAEARRAKEIEKRDATRLANQVHAEAIVKALKAHGFDKAAYSWEVSEWVTSPKLTVDNTERWNAVRIEFTSNYSGGSYYNSHETPVILVEAANSYRQSGARYPIRKDGTFNYEKIALKAVELDSIAEKVQDERTKKENNRRLSRAIAEKLQAQFGLESYWGPVKESEYHADRVNFKVDKSLTEDQAAQMLELMSKLGLLK